MKAAVDLPIQAQCEPPDDDIWFERLSARGVDSLGMHLEVVTPELRRRIMPGKSEVPVERYIEAFAAAVAVFGRGQVTTYILAGLGDSAEAISRSASGWSRSASIRSSFPSCRSPARRSKAMPAPSPEFMHAILHPLARNACRERLKATDIKAGCGKCGACSALSTYERRLAS